MSGRTTPSPDPVTDYATRVVSGSIIANKWVRLACQRHLSDLSRPDLYWDPAAAKRHIDFFEKALKLAFNEEPHLRPFKLLPHQKFIQGSLFGWRRRKPDGSLGPRRFWYAYIEGGKGLGKTPMAAGTGLFMATADGEPEAHCYFAASSKDQARIGFDTAVTLRDNSPEIAVRLAKSGVNPCVQMTYAYPQKDSERMLIGSFLKPIASGYIQSGPRPHFVGVDEVHELSRTAVLDIMRKALGKNRSQPMIYEITNSGVDRTSICYQHRVQAQKMLDGTIPNDSLFAYICGLDEGSGNPEDCVCGKSSTWDRRTTCPCCGDLPSDIDGVPQDTMEYLLAHEEIWVKANPGIGEVPSYEYVRQQIKDAIGLPSQRNLVLRLHFCVWTDAVSVWIPDAMWMKGAADTSLADIIEHPVFGRLTRLEAELLGRRCYGGADIAASNDWSSLVLLFPDDLSGLDPNDQIYSLLEWFWIDEETFNERRKKNPLIEAWQKDGHLIVTPGDVFNPATVRAFITERISPMFKIDAIAYDRTFFHQIVLDLKADGLNMVDFPQSYWFMSSPVKEIMRRARAGLWRHRGHPVMREMMKNVSITSDPGGGDLQKIDKKRSTEKVDGPVALANAQGWCMRANTGAKKSVYERRDPVVIDDVYL